jgi:hypothetical protein
LENTVPPDDPPLAQETKPRTRAADTDTTTLNHLLEFIKTSKKVYE